VLLDRERRVLIGGAVAAAVLLAFSFLVVPPVSRLKTLSRVRAAAENELTEVRKARPELERSRADTARRLAAVNAAADRRESPAGHLAAILQGAGISQQAIRVKSGGVRDGETFREESFEVRMENLTYLEAVQAIRHLSGEDVPVVVRSAILKSRFDDPRYLDVALRAGYLSPKP